MTRYPKSVLWYWSPRIGDTIDTPDGRSREVIACLDDRVQYRDQYGTVQAVGLKAWQDWARRNEARIRHYGMETR